MIPACPPPTRWRVRLTLVAFVGSAAAVLVATLAFPMAYNVWLSLHEYNLAAPYLGRGFVGLRNYLDMLSDPNVANALKNTAIVTVGSLLLEIPIGLALALGANRRLAGRRFFQFVFVLPLLLVPVVVAFMWRFIFQYDGLANYVLGGLGLGPYDWAGPDTGLLTIIIVVSWQNTPFSFIMFLAGLQSIDPALTDAAEVDGAGPVQRLLRITLPLVKPFLLIILAIRTMDLLRVFDEGFILTGGGPGRSTELLSQLVYSNSFVFFDIGRGSAISILQAVLIALCVAAYFVLLSPRERHGHGR